jgi:hypothetical protein
LFNDASPPSSILLPFSIFIGRGIDEDRGGGVDAEDRGVMTFEDVDRCLRRSTEFSSELGTGCEVIDAEPSTFNGRLYRVLEPNRYSLVWTPETRGEEVMASWSNEIAAK